MIECANETFPQDLQSDSRYVVVLTISYYPLVTFGTEEWVPLVALKDPFSTCWDCSRVVQWERMCRYGG